ncbi:MAG: GAF domain-containing protein [Chloroflexota bacterium]
MNEKKQIPPMAEEINPQRVFWGTLAMDFILLLVIPYFLVTLFRQSGGGLILSLATGVFAIVGLTTIASVALTLRRRQEAGLKLNFYALFALGILINALIEGRILTSSFSIFTVSAIAIQWLFPRRERRRYFVIAVAITALMWVINWINPPWRIEIEAVDVGPIGAVLFGLILLVILVRQAWYGTIRTKLVASFLVATILPLAILAVINFVNSQNALEREALDTVTGYYQTFQSRIDAERQAAEALAIGIAAREDVRQIYLDGDREKLYETLAPLFEEWKQRQIVHLYIENPDGTVFLRVHKPESFGDNVTYRQTAATVMDRRVPASGIEIGPNRLGVRGVAPMYSFTDGSFIGMAEVGLDFDEAFIANLKEDTSADFTMWVTYAAAETPDLNPAEGAPAAPIEEVFFYASSLPDGALADPELYRAVLETGEPAFQILTEVEPPTVVYVAPLLGYNDQTLGLLQISEPYTETVTAQTNAVLVALVVVAGLVLISMFAIYLLANRLVLNPMAALTSFAERQTKGEVKARVSLRTGDEFEKLAGTFNFMAESVEQERQTLELRVEERTRNLELAAEVGRAVSQLSALDVMLRDAAEIIRSRFDLYYVQVYLSNPGQTELLLQAGTGPVGAELIRRGHRLPINDGSINGRAAVETRPVVISDTASSASFRPNPLLPDTRSEMAVPLILGGNVVGVLDLQSQRAGELSPAILPAFQALAGQLAVAIQNANLLADAEQARAEVEKQARRLVRANWEDYLDAIHTSERMGFAFEANEVIPLVETEEAQTPAEEIAISTSIAVTGEALGSLVVELASENQTPFNMELINTVARQVGQQIENLRLLESAERYRQEAEQAARRLTRQGWQEFARSKADQALSYVYDLKEVRPEHAPGDGKEERTLALPLKVRDEVIGKLAVLDVDPDNQETTELVNDIAERLGSHIENLRLLEETKRGQAELESRARQLQSVAEISTVSAREADLQRMLETVVHLTQRRFRLYHAHVFTYNEDAQRLEIVACGWKEGDEHEGTHGTAKIPLQQEQSLVARAGRALKPVIVNDVRNEPGWLPNPLLPDTASEMAIPLVVGDQLLGVLDVQSDRLNAFTEEDANIQTTLASQVATSMQNARSFFRAQKQAEREAMLNAISQKIQGATTVEAVLQIAARELGHALGAPLTIAQLGMKPRGNGS